MYAFSMLAMPLSFFAVSAWMFRESHDGHRAFSRGLLLGIPGTLLWALLAPLFTPLWGSPLLVLSFLLEHWIVPFGLTTAAFALAVGFSGLRCGTGYERAVAFFAGSLTVFGFGRTVSSWGDPSRVTALVVPIVVVTSAYAFVGLLEEAAKDGFPGAVKYIALAVIGSAVAATGAALFFMRLEWLGAVMSALFTAGAVLMGWKRLGRPERPANPVSPAQPDVQPRRGRTPLPLK